jgi:hypothetical protein
MLIPGAWWSLERGAGVAALALLTLATVLVVAGAGRAHEPLRRALVLGALAAAAVHGVAVLAGSDSGSLTPLGALAALLLVGLALAGQRGVGERALEWLTIATWAVVVLHAAGPASGLDGRWGLALVAGGLGLLAASAAFRAARRTVTVPEPPAPPPPAPPAPPARTPHRVPSPLWSSREAR